MALKDRLKQRIEELGTNPAAVARTANLNPTGVRDILQGKSQNPRSDTLKKLAVALRVSENWLMGVDDPSPNLPPNHFLKRVVGVVQAGVWTETNEIPFEDQREVIVPMPEGPLVEHVFLLDVRGDSMNRADILDGDTVACIPFDKYPKDLQTGDMVVAYRSDGHGLIEATIKELDIREDGACWLWPRSDDPEFAAPIKLPSPSKWPSDMEHLSSDEVYVQAVYLGRAPRQIKVG